MAVVLAWRYEVRADDASQPSSVPVARALPALSRAPLFHPSPAAMNSTDLDAVAHRSGPDAATFASLPLPLAQRVFLALPLDARALASCVCRA